MLEFHSQTADTAMLHRRLERLLARPAGASPAPLAVSTPRPARRGWRARYRGWRMRHPGPLILSLPGVGDVLRLGWALLTVQGRLHRLLSRIEEADKNIYVLHQRLDQHVQHAQRASALLDARLDEDAALLRHQQAHVQERLNALFDVAENLEKFQRERLLDRRFFDHGQQLLERQLLALRDLVEDRSARALPEYPRLDQWYMKFETHYRGTPEAVRERFSPYLPLIRAVVHDPDAAEVLDLGCGRGDFLRVLLDAGILGLGVDSSQSAVAAARTAGVRVHSGDLFDYLHLQDDASIGVLTAFQVVEHLPLAALMHLFDEARRVLRPGGLVIFETPNPENLQVGAYSFWLDPTHQRPLPPPLLFQLGEHFGFEQLQILRGNPWPQANGEVGQGAPSGPDVLPSTAAGLQSDDFAAALCRLLYCEQDYALIAYAPQSSAAN